MQNIIQIIIEIILLPYIVSIALLSRLKKKKIDVGIGPEPMINNIYHKKSLELYNYKVETFVVSSYFITSDFDIDLSDKYDVKTIIGKLKIFFSLINLSFKYRVLYFYFNGGPLGLTSKIIWYFEPFIYKIANVKTLLMPYGGDVQNMTHCKNLYFKHVLSKDYPFHKQRRNLISKKIDLWTNYANHIISGCDWVDYMSAWDTLMIAHFSIDTEKLKNKKLTVTNDTFKVFHAPNHKSIKGTSYLINAVEELKDDGYKIELIMCEKVSNKEILNTINSVDIVADQFVVGWYAMFALEAMSMGKPVMCYLRDDLIELYTKANLIKNNEIPIINTNVLNIKEKIIWAYNNKKTLDKLGEKSKLYVKKHHSLSYIGKVFHNINEKLLKP
jgi:glycosyltransferase involved in cell wall biosynthesis